MRRISLGGEFQAIGFIPYFSLAHPTEPIIFKRLLIVSNEGLEQSKELHYFSSPSQRSLPVRYPSGGMDLDGILLTVSVGIGVLPVLMQFALLK